MLWIPTVVHFLPFLVVSRCFAADIQVSVPPKAPTNNVVKPNFLGISFELSFMDQYFGNDTSTIPRNVISYLAAVRSRTGTTPLRLRVGGNSMDSSTYVPDQQSPMVKFTNPAENSNDQPVNYGPVLWDVMKKVAEGIGGAEYLVGLPLINPNDPQVPTLAGAATQGLGNTLDGFLLGNEPDLYSSHGNRAGGNYTLEDYIGEFQNVTDRLANTSAGNLLELKNMVGPTICCSWDLDTVLLGGYLLTFNKFLKYISVQHYPQNNCGSNHAFELPYYIQHANAVTLASWQKPGILTILSNTSSDHPQLIMSEFNSASCGGLPNISDTFAVGSLWTVDYALQMASVGYSAVYLHTRERGVTYNIFTPPGPSGGDGPWVTNPPYYALLATAEALQSTNGGIVVDLDIGGSKSNINATVAGYAVYDASGSNVQQFVLFNYANTTTSSATFVLPQSAFSATSGNVVVKYLSAQDLHEQNNIGWGGQSSVGLGDGSLRNVTAEWATPNKILDCTKGCSVEVPGIALAVVFARGTTTVATTTTAAATEPATTTVTTRTETAAITQTGSPQQNGQTSSQPSLYLLQGVVGTFIFGLFVNF